MSIEDELGRRLGADMQAKPFRGLYRTVAWAYVTNGTMSFQVPEAEYRAFKYEPDFDSLPWKESYNAASTTVGLQKPAN